MDVSFAFVCDYADSSAKLTAVGIGFDTIFAKELPASRPVFYTVAAFRFRPVEAGPKAIEVHIIDADGGEVVPPLKAEIEVGRPAAGYRYTTQRMALGLHGVRFPDYGDYEVSWLIDGHEVALIPLKVAPPPNQT